METASPAANPALTTARSSIDKYLVLAGAIMVQLILGTVYGYSVFWQPLERDLWPPVITRAELAEMDTLPANVTIVADEAARLTTSQTRQGQLKYAFAICLLSFATAMVFAGRLQDIKGPRFTATLGGLILGCGFLIAGQMQRMVTFYICHALLMGSAVVVVLLLFEALFKGVSREKYPVLRYVPNGIVTVAVVVGLTLGNEYVSNTTEDRVFLLWATIGLLAGVGIGYAYVCPIAALVKWFPNHKGLVSGIAVAGFGMGAYVFSSKTLFGAVGFIENFGITRFFSVHAVIATVAVIVGAMMLRNPPDATAPAGRTGPPDADWQQLLRTPRFYVVWSMFFSGAMAGLMVIGILKPFAGGQLVQAALAQSDVLTETARSDLMLKGAAAVGVLALFNAAGRIVWGLLSDFIGRTLAMTVMFAFQGVTLLMLVTLDTEAQLVVGAACVGFNFGGNFALFPSLTADLFGAKNFGANYGWVFTSYGVAGVTGVWVGNLAQEATGSYFVAFAIAAGLCFFSAILALISGRAPKAAAA